MRRLILIALLSAACTVVTPAAWASNGCGREGEVCCHLVIIDGTAPDVVAVGENGCALGLECVADSPGGTNSTAVQICTAARLAPTVSGTPLIVLALLMAGAGAAIGLRRGKTRPSS
jgi:hypothetical protein